jgi:hypothetical protein
MYLQKSFAEKLKEFDVYRKLPKEYLQPSFLGALCNFLLTNLIFHY